MNRLIFWLLFLPNFGFASAPNSLESDSNSNRIGLAIFRIFGWICGSAAVILPLDTAPAELVEATKTGTKLNQASADLMILMALNPEDKDQVKEQYEITFKRPFYGTGKDRLSVLDSCLLQVISEFLGEKDALEFRALNRTLLLHQIISSRFRLFLLLKPKITSGFDVLHGSTLSASVLLDPLTKLIKYGNPNTIAHNPNSKIDSAIEIYKEALNSATNLKDLLVSGLFFLRYTNISACMELLEAIVKAKIFEDEKFFIPKLQITSYEMFSRACNAGHLCLVKTLLTKFRKNFGEYEIHRGLLDSIKNDYFAIFKLVLNSSKDILTMDVVKNLSTLSITNQRLQFVQLLFHEYQTLKYIPHRCLDIALFTKNLDIIEFVLKMRGESDFNIVTEFGLNVLEIAASDDHLPSLKLLFRYPSADSLLRRPKSLLKIVQSKSKDCLEFLLEKLNEPIDIVFGQYEATVLLTEAVFTHEINIVKLLLSSTKSKVLETVCVHYDDGTSYTINAVQIAIKEEFQDGFEALIEHFGTSILALKDGIGRNSFMIAATYGNLYYVNRIATLCPELLNKRDNLRNNALHILLTLNPSIEFIKEISKLKIDWRAINRAGKMPIEMLNSMANVSMNDDLLNIYNNILSNIEE